MESHSPLLRVASAIWIAALFLLLLLMIYAGLVNDMLIGDEEEQGG